MDKVRLLAGFYDAGFYDGKWGRNESTYISRVRDVCLNYII